MVASSSDAWLLDEGSGRSFSVEEETEFEASEWSEGYGVEVSEWMPGQWGQEANGDPLLLSSLYGPMGLPPVIDSGLVFSRSNARPPRLAAYGADTTPPFGEIRIPAERQDSGQRTPGGIWHRL